MTSLHHSPASLHSPAATSKTGRWQYRLLAFTFPCALVLGTVGYLHYPHGAEPVALTNALYHAAQLFILHAPHFEGPVPWTLELARWLAAASTGWVLVETAWRLLHVERASYRLQRMQHHAVVCGLGRRGLMVIESLRQKGKSVVAVEKAPEPDAMERLHKLGVPLVIGDAARLDVLREARLDSASTLYALCAEDTTNCEIATRAAQVALRPGTQRQCFVHISDTELRSVLQGALVSLPDSGRQQLNFVDAFDPEALNLLVHGLPLDHDGIRPGDARQAHLIILGFGRMGRTLAVRAAQLGHFIDSGRVRISVVDRKADAHRAALLFHHPQIEQVVDLTFHQREVVSPEARALVEGWCHDPQTLTSLVVCFDHETLALEIALELLPVFEHTGARVALRLPGQGGLAHLLDEVKSGKHARIHTFGLDERFTSWPRRKTSRPRSSPATSTAPTWPWRCARPPMNSAESSKRGPARNFRTGKP